MFYYSYNEKTIISKYKIDNLKPITKESASNSEGIIFSAANINPNISRRSFSVSEPSLLFIEKENLDLINLNNAFYDAVPEWLKCRIKNGLVSSINLQYPYWEDALNLSSFKAPVNINVIGLGDVGGTLISGLRLLGGNLINRIGIYDKDINKIKRWYHEIGQIVPPNHEEASPEIVPLNKEEIFDCDFFVFCVSVGVPEIGSKVQDVRLAQFNGNTKIIKYYSRLARECSFKGQFAVVSDPVDLLCKAAFEESNKDETGNFDYIGLAPEQIKGYGLGVMNARAIFYAKQDPLLSHYLYEGRAFGPHGEGLIIADSIENYNEELSNILTEKAKKANLEVRAAGFKPYIAPALSSAALPIIAAIRGEWHYSSVFIGGTFMGLRNRLLKTGTEIETYNLTDNLFTKLNSTYSSLQNLYINLSKGDSHE